MQASGSGLPTETAKTLERVRERGDTRLLPWKTESGKECLLSTDDPAGPLSRIADALEEKQIEAAGHVLEAAISTLTNPLSPRSEIEYMSRRLVEVLADVMRIAESGRLRLPATASQRAEDK